MSSHTELVVTPSSGGVRRLLRTAPYAVIAGIVTSAIVLSGPIALVMWLVAAAAAAIAMRRFLSSAEVAVDDDEISQVGLLGTTRRRPRSDVAQAVLVTIAEAFGDVREYRHLYVLDTAGRAIVHMHDGWWEEHDMRRVVGRLGVEPVVLDGPMTSRQLRARYPLAQGPLTRHPILTALGGIAATAALVAVLTWMTA